MYEYICVELGKRQRDYTITTSLFRDFITLQGIIYARVCMFCICLSGVFFSKPFNVNQCSSF